MTEAMVTLAQFSKPCEDVLLFLNKQNMYCIAQSSD